MYSLNYDKFTGKVSGIKRLPDNAFIPLCETNTDYQEFLIWNKAQKTPLDLNSTIPVILPVPARDFAKELDVIKVDLAKTQTDITTLQLKVVVK